MIKRKNRIRLLTTFFVTIIAIIVVVNIFNVKIEKIINCDFYNTCITLSSVIAGFLFTGISILISVIDKDRIQRLWKNNYLDNLYRSAFLGIIMNIITIIISIVLSCFYVGNFENCLIKFDIVSLFEGIVFFIWCVIQLMFVIVRLKK